MEHFFSELVRIVIEKLNQAQNLDVNLTKSVDRENEVRFHVPGRRVHIMINMWTKHGCMVMKILN